MNIATLQIRCNHIAKVPGLELGITTYPEAFEGILPLQSQEQRNARPCNMAPGGDSSGDGGGGALLARTEAKIILTMKDAMTPLIQEDHLLISLTVFQIDYGI